MTGDTASYEKPARALVETGRFAAGPDQVFEPETLRTPGYPLFLAGVYGLFGARRDIVVVMQVWLSSCTVLLLYGLGTRLSTPGAALAAAAFLVLGPLSFVYSQLLFSESIFTLALMLAAWCAVAQLRGGPLWWSALFGLCLAAATLIRLIAYYLIAPSVVALAIYGRAGLGWDAARGGHSDPARPAALVRPGRGMACEELPGDGQRGVQPHSGLQPDLVPWSGHCGCP